jgi:hypothetical protein
MPFCRGSAFGPFALVAQEIVHDDDIALSEDESELCLHIA